MPGKILVSGLFVHPGKVGGAENYLYNLLKGFDQLGAAGDIDLLLNAGYSDYNPVVQRFNPIPVRLMGNRAFYDYLLPRVVTQYPAYESVLLPNYVTPLGLFASGRQPRCVTTIHDLLYLHFPRFFSMGKRLWQNTANLHTLNRADKVVCISDFVRHDILERFGEKYKNKLQTIHNPIDFDRFGEVAGAEKPYPHDYILSVSAMYPHKNTLTLLKAFREYKKKTDNGVKLVLAGQLPKHLLGSDFGEYHKELSHVLAHTPDIIVTGYIPNRQLDILYRHCLFFVYPSLFEGFGMPVVEALGCGKPAITTKCASLYEVSMGKAVYVENPASEHELAEKIAYCYDNLPGLTREAARLTPILREKYSVQNIAGQYYRALMG
ncbi:MAG: hypothetical protein AVDCRST_MAG56-70 [uncultured Cytophagales bacterium]|uniref:Mannosyltransferase n=1 Tax=uncultured Cytophagales bacterium TaxID=158755 RepID=A0A6J4H3P6_9SPHI|nr:MAG: hypothetical protein AVDCRST_MAG56-70 [uncultured Cytophagales bacterium]